MNLKHDSEKKQFNRLFQQQGINEFEKRLKVLEAFLGLEKHVTCEEISDRLEEEGLSLNKVFIAETMEFLSKFGFAHRIKFDDGIVRYEHRHLGFHHDHMVCTRCGKIIEFKDENLEKSQMKLAAAYGFHMLQHKMEIYGICSECLQQRTAVIPLEKIKQGEKAVIKRLEGGRKFAARMAAMGIRIGEKIEIVSTQLGGQVVVAVAGSRYVLGAKMAAKIMVQPVKNGDKTQDAQEAEKNGTPESKRMSLSEMKEGQEGEIVRVSGAGRLKRRFLEMGINRGTRIYVEKYAPLRDPMELVVKGYHVSLRVQEAAAILVENVRDANSK